MSAVRYCEAFYADRRECDQVATVQVTWPGRPAGPAKRLCDYHRNEYDESLRPFGRTALVGSGQAEPIDGDGLAMPHRREVES